jgi:hypothetical protein
MTFPKTQSRIAALHEDADGRVWVFLSTSTQSGPLPEGRLDDPAFIEQARRVVTGMSYVEVLDPARAALITSLENPMGGVPLRTDIWIVPRIDARGDQQLDVKRVELLPNSAGGRYPNGGRQ